MKTIRILPFLLATFTFTILAAPLHAEEGVPPSADAPFLEDENSMPEPSLGEMEEGATASNPKKKVSSDALAEEEGLFLPPPSNEMENYSDGNGELNTLMQGSSPTAGPMHAPSTSPAPAYNPPKGYAGHSMYNDEEDEWNDLPKSRPAFSLMFGPISRTYPNPLIKESTFGLGAGAALRVWQASPQFALFANAGVGFVKLGDIGTAKGTSDRVYHFGMTGEYSLSRKFHLVFGLQYFRNVITSNLDPRDPEEFVFLKDRKFKPGIGLQYDIYSRPHASLGARLYLERDYTELMLNFSFEASPRKRMSFNYNWGEY